MVRVDVAIRSVTTCHHSHHHRSRQKKSNGILSMAPMAIVDVYGTECMRPAVSVLRLWVPRKGLAEPRVSATESRFQNRSEPIGTQNRMLERHRVIHRV